MTLLGRDGFAEHEERQQHGPPRMQNPIQHRQLRRRLSVQQAASQLGLAPARYRAVVGVNSSEGLPLG